MSNLVVQGLSKQDTHATVVVIDDLGSQNILEHHRIEPGCTIAEWVDSSDLDTTSTPVICLYNAVPKLRAEMEQITIRQGDIVTMVLQGGIAPLVIAGYVIAAVTLAYSLYTVLTLDIPSPADRKKPSPTYSLSIKGNKRRPGEPRPVVLGSPRIYPDIIGQYPIYQDGEMYLNMLFECSLTNLEEIKPGDVFFSDTTPLTSFAEYDLEFVPIGQESKLFPSEEFISAEVDGIPVNKGHDEGWTQAYFVNPPGTEVTTVYFDVSFPQGLYWVDEDGDIRWFTEPTPDPSVENLGLYIEFHIRAVDDNGVPLGAGSWGVHRERFYTDNNNPIRRTVIVNEIDGVPINPHRYEARIYRWYPAAETTTAATDMLWERLRGTGTGPSSDVYGTRLAIKMRQSGVVGNQALGQISVNARAKVLVYDGSSWTLQQTNSAVWAFCELIIAYYAGRMPVSRLDLESLLAIENSNNPLNEFHGVIDTETDLWSALNEIARCLLARAVELYGGVYTMVIDEPNVAPTSLFTMDRIVAGSFTMEELWPVDEEENWVRVTFQDKQENYRENSVPCIPNGVTPGKAKEIHMRGPVTVSHAWEIGIRLANEMRWRRRVIQFETGIEGLLPTYGSTIAVSYVILSNSQAYPSISGSISGNSGRTLFPFEDVTRWAGRPDIYCTIRNKDGSPGNPLHCAVNSNNEIILYSGDLSGLVYSDDAPNPSFALGIGSEFTTTIKVTAVEPVGTNHFKISGVDDNPNVYIRSDHPTVPRLAPGVDVAPRITNLRGQIYGPNNKPRLKISWNGHNSDYYVVELSEDSGANWYRVGRTMEERFDTPAPLSNNIYVGVTGVGTLAGKRQVLVVNTDDYFLDFSPVRNLRMQYPFDEHTVAIEWDRLKNNEAVAINVWWNGEVKGTFLLDNSQTQFALNWWQIRHMESYALDGAQWPVIGSRDITFQVIPSAGDQSYWSPNYAQIRVQNEQMGLPLNLTLEEKQTDLVINYKYPAPDPAGIDIHMSQTSGFTPDLSQNSTTRVYRGPDTNITLRNILVYPNTYFFKLACFDIFGATDLLQWTQEYAVSTTDPAGGGTELFGVGITRNQSEFGGPANDGWVFVHGFNAGSPVNQDGFYWHQGQNRVVPVGGINCKGFDAGCLLAHDMGGNGRIGGADIGPVFWINDAYWLQNEGEVLSPWAQWDHEDCVIIGSIDVASDRITSASTFPPVSPDYYHYLYSVALWSALQDPDGTKPEDNAQVNGGDGVNIMPGAYHTFHDGEILVHIHQPSPPQPGDTNGWSGVASGQGKFQSGAMFVDRVGVDNYAFLAETGTTWNIPIRPNSKFIVSFWAKCNSGTGTGKIQFRTEQDTYFTVSASLKNINVGGTFTCTTTWQEYIGVIDMTSSSAGSMNCICHNDSGTAKTIYWDGFHLERMINESVTPALTHATGFTGTGQHTVKTEMLIPDATTAMLYRERGSDAPIPNGDPVNDPNLWYRWAQNNFSWRQGNIVTFRAVMGVTTDDPGAGGFTMTCRWLIDEVELKGPTHVFVVPFSIYLEIFTHELSFQAPSTEENAVVAFEMLTSGTGNVVVYDSMSSYTLTETKR